MQIRIYLEKTEGKSRRRAKRRGKVEKREDDGNKIVKSMTLAQSSALTTRHS